MTLTLTARDAFDEPVPDAEIGLLRSSGTGYLEISTRTGADGRAQVVGGFEGVYAAIVRAPDLFGISYEPSSPAADQIDFEVTLHPDAAVAAGIGDLSVTNVSTNGRQLDFTARLYVVERNASETQNLASWNIGNVLVLPCEPDTGNDAVDFGAECVEGGLDANYDGAALAANWVEPATTSDPLAVVLLVDQGAGVTAADPDDRRLLAARYLQTRFGANDHVAVAAFAADDAATGDVALLPDQPVTLYPVSPSGFTTEGRAYFPAIDSFLALEGGASPLYAASEEMIDFAAAQAPDGTRRAVVAQASGISDCASVAECRSAQDSLRQHSAIADVHFAVVGFPDPSQLAARKKLGALAQSALGTIFWAQDPMQVPTVIGRIPAILSGRHPAVDVTMRLKSPVAGTFASGRTVFGTLRVVVCPWECTESADVPFTLHIP
jgi:hypothetical protein